MTRPPVNTAALAAYSITNAQVTARQGAERRFRTNRDVLVQSRSLILQGKANQQSVGLTVRQVQGRCESPIRMTEKGGRSNAPILDTYVRCRKCSVCLRARRALWASRAKNRIGLHARTWMVTLTLRPEVHYIHLLRAEKEARARAINPADWTEAELFAERWKQFGKEITKWLKRLRHHGANFVYLLVTEAHKTGLPHAHLLIHELSTVRYSLLGRSWELGFCHCKLVSGPESALYVTKYLTKSALARVRASKDY